MKSIFICYPKCSTCQKARKFLEEKGIEFEERHIVEQNPKQDELKRWIAQSGLPALRPVSSDFAHGQSDLSAIFRSGRAF